MIGANIDKEFKRKGNLFNYYWVRVIRTIGHLISLLCFLKIEVGRCNKFKLCMEL